MRKSIACFFIFFGYWSSIFAQECRIDTLSASIHFHQGISKIEPSYAGNAAVIDSIESMVAPDSAKGLKISSITVTGSASPEGGIVSNKHLSEKRATNLYGYIVDHLGPTAVPVSNNLEFSDIDWPMLKRLVAGSGQEWADEVIDIINNVPVWIFKDGKIVDGRKRRLGMLHGGRPWNYMQEHFFPLMRYATVTVVREQCVTEKMPEPEVPLGPEPSRDVLIDYTPDEISSVMTEEALAPPAESKHGKINALLKTNMLYDAMLIPNIGIELPIGKDWSLHADWMYAWWKTDVRHRYWRVYGGQAGARRWFGQTRHGLLTGHHLGVYGQI